MAPDLILDIDVDSGEYCVLRLTRLTLAATQPLSPLAAGNLFRAPCAHTDCASCAAEPGCGWCSKRSVCLQGGPLAPCEGGCADHWTQGYCSETWPCSHHLSCDECLGSKLCGWCESEGVAPGAGLCMAGNELEPLQLICRSTYRYHSCSGVVGTPTLVT